MQTGHWGQTMADAGFTMPWGAQWLGKGRAVFHVWAPAASAVDVQLNGRHIAMSNDGGDGKGRWHAEADCTAGMPYRFVLTLADGKTLSIADPASRAQQGDVDGDSLVVDPGDYQWQHAEWQGRPWHEAVIYELHVGALGGFDAVAARLPALAALGITAIELMPVADFPGPRNWGYDGVLPFAPDSAYGSPSDLKRLIDTAHGLGLMVLLDVVYNHFGPDGNYLHDYAPGFFKADAATAWGGAIDFAQAEVRSFFTSNARYWIEEYRFDGLRIDAAHAIAEQDWFVEMAAAVRSHIPSGRHVHLVLEHDGNAAGLLRRGFDAQWNDDGHHTLHVLLTGEKNGYYRDYADAPAELLARCLAEGFAYQGEASQHRGGAARGEPSASLPPTAFVLFLQNHDQTGNRAQGDRLSTLAAPAALRAAQALQLLAPQIPLLFMGEECGCTGPFLYFTSHRTPELAEAVRRGRRAEFADFAQAGGEDGPPIPDPNDEATFARSIPPHIGEQGHPSTAAVRELLALRQRHIVPQLPHCHALGAHSLGPAAVTARWQLGPRVLVFFLNLAPEPVPAPPLALHPHAETLFDSGGVREALASGSVPGHGFVALLEPA
jgi:maltooligosyltrehalose trehalohydrolase